VSPGSIEVRVEVIQTTSREAAERPELAPLTREPSMPAALAVCDGSLRGAAVLDGRGGPTEPGVPLLRLEHTAADADLDTEVRPLLEALQEVARRDGAARVVIGWDPMDRPGLRMLEAIGFASTGTMPYFPLGGDQVEYVSGYRDATGSILDLAWMP
jgi:hypothetical protein